MSVLAAAAVCGQCGKPGTRDCVQCEQTYCDACSEAAHEAGDTRYHTVLPVGAAAVAATRAINPTPPKKARAGRRGSILNAFTGTSYVAISTYKFDTLHILTVNPTGGAGRSRAMSAA